MFAAKLKSKTAQSIFAAVTVQISNITARGFKPSKLCCDLAVEFSGMQNTLTSVITGFRIYYKTAKMINAVP